MGRRLLLSAALLLSTVGHAGETSVEGKIVSTTTLEIGIFPYMSTRTLLTTFQPLQQFLQMRLRRPVLLITAPNMRAFVERSQRGEYRFMLTAPHFARLAQLEAGYLPMLTTSRELRGALIVNKDSSIKQVDELRGKTIATPDGIALITMLGVQLLRANGLKPGEDVVLQTMPSHDAAVLSLQPGNGVSAAIISLGALEEMSPEVKNGVRALAATRGGLPPSIYLAHPATPATEVAEMSRLLREFGDSSVDGKKFTIAVHQFGLRPPTVKEMQSLDPYVSDLKNLLGTAR